MFIRKLATIAAATALVAAPAFASQRESNSRSVHYRDLDLSAPAGLATLHHRISEAVEAVCGSYGGTMQLEEKLEIHHCRVATQRRADARVAALVSGSTRLASRQ
ncbi:MAG: UrcA family protein [Alphaproteobacteria bacterium]|nr:UrcA family protein [Alphaproteobacteria bacterium]